MREIEDYEWEIIHYKDEDKKDVFLSLFMNNLYIGRIESEKHLDKRIVNIAKHLNVFL